MQLLPSGWTVSHPSAAHLVIYKCQCSPPLSVPQVTFSIQVMCVFKLCMICLIVYVYVILPSFSCYVLYQIIASGITWVFMGFESLWLCARPKELFTAKKFLLSSLKCLFHLRHCEHSQLEQDLCRKWRWEVWKYGRCSQRCLQEPCK